MALQFNSPSPSGEIEVVKSSAPHNEDPETEIRKLRSSSYDGGELHHSYNSYNSYNSSKSNSTHTSGTSTPVGYITPPESPVIDSRSIMGTFGTHLAPLDIPNDISGDRETVDALLRASYGRNTTVMVKLKTDAAKEKSEEEFVLPPQVIAAIGNSGIGSTRAAKRLSIKTDKCVSCGKSVYQLERMQADNGKIFHRSCFKCSVCSLTLELTNFATNDDKLYCENHFKNLRHQRAFAQFEKDKVLVDQEEQEAAKREQEAREREREKALKTKEERIKNGQITTATATPTPVGVSLDDKVAADREERMWAQRELRLHRAAIEKQMNDPVEFEKHREEERKRVLALKTSGTAADREERERERRAREDHERKEREEKERKEKEERERREKEEREEKERKEKEEKEEKEKREKEEKEKKAREEEEKLKKEREEKERLERERAQQEKEKAEREAEEWEKIQQELRKKATEAAERFLREPEPLSVAEESFPSKAPPEDDSDSEEESSDTISPTITPSHSSNSLLWVPLTPGLLSSQDTPTDKSKDDRKLEREQKRKEKEERKIRREERMARRAAREERRKKREEAAQKKAAEQQQQPVEQTIQ